MTISEKSIIDPEQPKPGIPIKKSTLGVIALLLLVGTFLTALLLQGGTAPAQQQPTAEKPAASSPTSGNASSIDDEAKTAAEAIARERRKQTGVESPAQAPIQSTGQAQAPSAAASSPAVQPNASKSPVPPNLKRDNQDAALYERAFSKASGGAGAGQSGAANRNDRDVESEAQARGSKSLAMDLDAPAGSNNGLPAFAGQDVGRNVATALLNSTTPAKVQPASASVQMNLDGELAALRNAQRPNQAGTGNKAWLNEYAGESGSKKSNDAIQSYPVKSKFTLLQGKVIPAALGRKINSDLPGEIVAYTTVDVYDSLGYGALLIPKGSVLVGRYNSEIKLGQERVLFAFQRLILPNGRSFDLPTAQGSDMAGASGVEGDVNNHFFKMFASSFFVAYVADKVATPSNVTVIGAGGTTSPAGQVLVDVSRSILERNKTIQPTITIEQGTMINVEVKRDMEFTGPYTRSRN